MRKILLVFSLLVLVAAMTNPAVAQDSKKKSDPASKLPFKKKLKFADGLFTLGSYYTAEEYYAQLLKEQPRNPYVTFKMAECLRYNRDYGPAADQYSTTYSLSSTLYPMAPFWEATMAKMDGQYERAIERFEFFKYSYKGKDKRKRFKDIDKDIAGCKMAMESLRNPERAYVKNAGPNVNTAYTEYSPLPLGDTALLFATMNQNKIIYKGKDKRQDYLSKFMWSPKEFDRTKIKDSFEVSMPFNDGKFSDKNFHVGNGSWSVGGDRFYFTKCREDDSMETICKIYVANFDKKKGIWGKPGLCPEVNFFEEGVSSTNPFCVFIGKKEVLFFSSNRKLQGVGGFDIWYSIYDSARQAYRRPQNCGKRINTVRNEITPYYDMRKGKLYFASDGQIGLGGFDIYSADGGPSRYYNVQNLGFPVNSPQDDMYYVEDPGEKDNAYVVSNRYGSYYVKNPTCCDDIWRVIKEPNFYVKGRVVDELTDELIDEVVIKMTNSSQGKIQDTFYSRTGNFMFYTPIGDNYSISADKEGYVSGRTLVNTSVKSVMDPDDTTLVTIYMQRIMNRNEFVVKNVYYDFNNGQFHPTSRDALDSLANFMKDNPSISVEIRSYTDNIGKDASNDALSQRRAQAVLDYMIQHGVERSRMIARGLGENNPLAPNQIAGKDNPEGRQYNRRTEFRVIGDVPGMRITYDRNRPEYIDKSGGEARRSNLNVPDEEGTENEPVMEEE